MNSQRDKHDSKSLDLLKSLFPMMRPFRIRIIVICICALIAALLRTLDPLLRQRLIDEGVLGGNLGEVVRVILLILGLFVLMQLSEIIQFFNYTYINKMLPFRLYHKALHHLMKLPVSFFKDANSTQIIQNISYDIGNVSRISDPVFVTSVVQGLCMIGGVVGLMIISWELTLLVLCIIPIKIIINHYYSNKRIKIFESAMRLNTHFAEWFGEAIQGIHVIKLWRTSRCKMSEFTGLKRKIIRNEYHMAGTEQANTVSSSAVDELLTGVLYILGAIFIFNDHLTLGGLFSFISYSYQVIGSISFLTRIKFYFTPIVPSLKRFLSFMEKKEEGGGRLKPSDNAPLIAFHNVSLNYSGKIDALTNVSFKIQAGEKVAIVGTNGSGKSSLIQLLLRLYEPSEGEITYCGVDICEVRLAPYRALFSIVEQKVFLFNASVRDNITLNQNISDSEIMEAASSLGVLQLISELPEGLDTIVGVDGAKLSGGQRQKLAALRALVRPHRILILDEATSNLDRDSEQMLNKLVLRNGSCDILLLITHRTDILNQIDKILVLEDGNLVGQGTYQELCDSCPAFLKCIRQEDGG